MAHHPVGTWAAICAAAGCDADLKLVPQRTFDDAMAVSLLTAGMEVLELSPSAFYEAYGKYFAHHYARRLYPDVYEQSTDFVSFVAAVNHLHQRITSENDGRPPFFELVWRSPAVLTISYRSDRGLIGVARGLILGYADYFGEEVEVDQASETRLDLYFAEPPTNGEFVPSAEPEP